MSLRKKQDKQITKGRALILAREILGPNARVYALYNPTECYIDLGPGTAAVVHASSWEEALELAHREPKAQVWQTFKDDRKQAFYNAVDSLRNTIREILGSKDVAHFTRAERKFVRGALGRLA